MRKADVHNIGAARLRPVGGLRSATSIVPIDDLKEMSSCIPSGSAAGIRSSVRAASGRAQIRS
jgi:hypothetical protein